MKLLFAGNTTDPRLQFYRESWRRRCFQRNSAPAYDQALEETAVIPADQSGDLSKSCSLAQTDVVIALTSLETFSSLLSGIKDRNIRVLLAAPFNLTEREHRQLEKTAAEKRLKTGRLWPARFDPGIAKLKEIIASGCLGEIKSLIFRLPEPSCGTVFQTTAEERGRLPQELHSLSPAPHIIDTMAWLLQTEYSASNTITTSFMNKSGQTLEFTSSVCPEKAVPVRITANSSASGENTIHIEGSLGRAELRGHSFLKNQPANSRICRYFSPAPVDHSDLRPIELPSEQPLQNCFGLLEKALSDDVCFDFFFQERGRQLCL